MAIEGPLRELGIHDVFQLLDLSRKTGRLRVVSTLRDNEGVVTFVGGRVVSASIRNNPHPIGQLLLLSGKITEPDLAAALEAQRQPNESRRLGEILVASGALTRPELERQVRRQIESVIFELLSWQEGYFSFSDEPEQAQRSGIDTGVSTESLLMEGARRIDEWARIADYIPSVSVVPAFADPDPSRASAPLELLPGDWEVLACVDGTVNVATIAATLGRNAFDVAKVLYGLVTTGVVTVSASTPAPAHASGDDDPVVLLADAREALHANQPRDALRLAERALAIAPGNVDARVEVARALLALERYAEADDAIARARESDPQDADVLMLVAGAAFRHGDLETATAMWERVMNSSPNSTHAQRAAEAITHARRLSALVESPHA